MTSRGRFIAFEGGEGTGKSTQVTLLAKKLEAEGHEVITTREPGGTELAERLRAGLLDGRFADYGANFETMVVYLARFDHLKQVIKPALMRGAWVITDRFSDSTRVYQGAASGADMALIEGLERGLVGLDKPDVTFILDLPVDEAMARVGKRKADENVNNANASANVELEASPLDRFDDGSKSFYETVRAAFLACAQASGGSAYQIIDAAGEAKAIAASVWDTLITYKMV